MSVLVAQGSYVGNGGTQDITLPWNAKFVNVKADETGASGTGVCRSDTMSTARATVFGNTSGALTLGTNKFTVTYNGADSFHTNKSGVTYYWYAVAGDSVITGTYTGHGTSQSPSVAHDPAMVWVLPAQVNDELCWKSSAMSGSDSWDWKNSAVFTNAITALGTGSFSVGGNVLVNSSSITYHYVSFAADAATMALGSYSGNGSDNRRVPPSAIGFDPDVVHTKGTDATHTGVFRIKALAGDKTLPYGQGVALANLIQVLNPEAGKWEVGNDVSVNENLKTYYYFAFKSIITKTGTDSTLLTGTEGAPSDVSIVPPTPPQTYSGATGDVAALITDLMVKATVNKITSTEILKQNIEGGDATAAQADQLSGKVWYIEEVDPAYPELRTTKFENATVQDIVAQLGPLADVAQQHPWYGAVWEGRHFHFRAMDFANVRWRVSKDELGDQGLQLERSLSSYWSHVQAFYLTGGNLWRSVAPKSSPKFRDNVPFKRRTVLDMGTAPVTTLARDAYYDDFKIPQPNTEITLAGSIKNAYGAAEPLWRVRAGDVFQIVDLFSDLFASGEASNADLLRSFLIKETSYDYAANMLRIVPAVTSDRLETLIANLKFPT